MLEIELRNDNGTFSRYEFVRDITGFGDWVCVSGKIPGSVGSNSSAGIIVDVEHAKDLTTLAVLRGIGKAEDFSRTLASVPKAAKAKATASDSVTVTDPTMPKVRRQPGRINPFTMTAKVNPFTMARV